MMEVPFHYRFRVIVVGDTMVGKSSLLKAFSEGHIGDMEPTVGVDFFSRIIEIDSNCSENPFLHNQTNDSGQGAYLHANSRSRQDDRIIIKLQIWDTAGQERFKSIVTSYYRNSVGVILVYDITNRESFEHLVDWIIEAQRHVEPSPSPTLSPIIQGNPSNFRFTSTPNKRKIRVHSPKTPRSSDHHSSLNPYSNTSDLSFNSLSDRRKDSGSESTHKMAYLILGCKTDLDTHRQVSYDEGLAFANSYGFRFIEASAKTNYNVGKAFQILAEEIYNRITECGRKNELHRTASGSLSFESEVTHMSDGIRLGPLIERRNRFRQLDTVQLLEAQPVSGYLGGCC